MPAPPAALPCGFLVLDKEAGLTSHACVARVRRAFGLRRVGHGGTLDPAVTGVLPIALGAATRLLPYLEGDKAYTGTVQLGVRTDSDDLTGAVLEQRPVPALTAADLELALSPWRGPVLQTPPQVSAVHSDGERAYRRARRGETMALAARPVTIQRLELLAWDPERARLSLAVRCSAGTYIRSLARDLGDALGCGGSLADLRRTEALGFDLEQAVALERLGEAPPPALIDPLLALPHLRRRQLTPTELESWRCGRAIPTENDAAQADQADQTDAADAVVAVVAPDGNLAGIARADGTGLLRPKLVFDAAG
jgi:tRNA pseudouridine55 synthase